MSFGRNYSMLRNTHFKENTNCKCFEVEGIYVIIDQFYLMHCARVFAEGRVIPIAVKFYMSTIFPVPQTHPNEISIKMSARGKNRKSVFSAASLAVLESGFQ